MAVEHCDYCDLYVDMDYNVEHFPEEYWEDTGRNHGKCQNQLDDEAQFHAEGQIKQTKIDRRTGHDKRWPDPNRGQ